MAETSANVTAKDAPPTYTVAVAGNPNSGKTTLFNALTGASQRVGNYPGVTVEKKEGFRRLPGANLHVVDLPGTYSLTAYSIEEVVARDFILDEKPDVVVDVVDASNLERNLYMALQLGEMGVPLVIALNMHDIAIRRGIKIDVERLSALLGVPVVPTVGHRKEGIDELLRVIAETAAAAESPAARRIDYGEPIEEKISVLEKLIENDADLKSGAPVRWLAVKLLEEDQKARERVEKRAADSAAIFEAAESAAHSIERAGHDEPAALIAEHRYGHAAGIVHESVSSELETKTITDHVDAVLCQRVLGLGFVALCMYAVFELTFRLADGWAWIPWPGGWQTPTGVFGWLFEELLPQLVQGMPEGTLKSLLADGIIAGVGGVIGFVPLIFFMFLLLAVIEDSGYIARIAFVLDRVLRTFGLQGKSVLAMIVSGGLAGGCAVPGVLATRTLRDRKDRLTTMLVVPFMNCGAKIPVYALLIAAFFAAHKGAMLWALAILSWTVALLAALLLRKTVITGESTPFVMELPPYHIPTLRGILQSAGQRSWMYVKKAGTIILAVSILLWAMMYYPRMDTTTFDQRREAADATAQIDADEAAAQLAQSVAGRLGRAFVPAGRLAGFDWRDNIALIGGFAAKEVIISTMGTAYNLGEVEPSEDIDEIITGNPLAKRLADNPAWTPLRAFAFMIFVMVYAPCFVTIAVIWRESGSWKWALFSTAYSTALAFVLATCVYQIGGLLGIGT